MNFKQSAALAFLGLLTLASSCSRAPKGFTKDELALIHGADSIMHVLTIEDPAECLVLRAPSSDLPAEALLSSDYDELARLMVATVTHPSQDGVGIAGPQVGLNRRVVAVQRFDKEPVCVSGKTDYPFEVYPNIRIVWAADSLAAGPEGCLSVPDRRGNVLRSTEIIIEYADLSSACTSSPETHDRNACGSGAGAQKVRGRGTKGRSGDIPMVRDTVTGFTAVIFQHEIDHLDGILYIDRL